MFVKVRWTSSRGATAGLVFDKVQLDRLSIPELSRRCPRSEATKMHRLEISPAYGTFEEAFLHQFEVITKAQARYETRRRK